MSRLFKFLSDAISRPVLECPATFVFLTVLVWAPSWTREISVASLFYVFCNLLFSSAAVFLICLVAHLLGRVGRPFKLAWLGISHVLVYGVFFFECFLMFFFGCHTNANVFQLIEETNPQETSEFFTVYVLNGKFFALCAVMILFAVVEFFAKKIVASLLSLRSCRFALSVYLLLALCVLLNNARYYSLEFREDWNRANNSAAMQSPLFFVFEAVSQFLQERNDFGLCVQTNANVEAFSRDSVSKTVVVIIGESFNRHHSSLYGYPLETNPRLSRLPGLSVFDNVISPINATSSAFRLFLSLSSMDDSREWSEAPLFPAIFKSAGYNVVFYSNQFVSAVGMSTYDASCGFFNHPELAPKLFSHRNSQKFQYDGELLDDYMSKRDSLESDFQNLVIIHLYGQHVNPAMRFPPERAKFNENDYGYRKELTQEQKRYVASYDNATVYNDSIVDSIIQMYRDRIAAVVYFADHGDEAYDFRNHVGRSRGLHLLGAQGLQAQLDVPFMIWLSDSWKENYPDDESRIRRHLHDPFVTDDLPHMLLELARVNHADYNPKKSLISDDFDVSRKRIIRPLALEPVDYDSVCVQGSGDSQVFLE